MNSGLATEVRKTTTFSFLFARAFSRRESLSEFSFRVEYKTNFDSILTVKLLYFIVRHDK